MNRTLPWLAAMVCAGWLSSSAVAWHPFAGLRHGTCTSCATDQNAPPATQIATDQPVLQEGSVVNGGVGCHNGVVSGYVLWVPQHVASAARSVNQWLLDVPQKTPPPPKPLVINPYTRSPRDYFMMD